jgi:hypothetical protein
MSFLPDEVVAVFRADIDSARRLEFFIVRPRRLDNGAGSTRPDPAGPERLGPFVGSFSTAGGHEQEDADQVAQRGSYRLRMPLWVEASETDQVEIAGRAYNVLWAPLATPTSLSRVLGIEEA